jgi:hypothetical protein
MAVVEQEFRAHLGISIQQTIIAAISEANKRRSPSTAAF